MNVDNKTAAHSSNFAKEIMFSGLTLAQTMYVLNVLSEKKAIFTISRLRTITKPK